MMQSTETTRMVELLTTATKLPGTNAGAGAGLRKGTGGCRKASCSAHRPEKERMKKPRRGAGDREMKGENNVTVKITGNPKEIAALVLAVQERQIRDGFIGKRPIEDDGIKDCAMTAGLSEKSFG